MSAWRSRRRFARSRRKRRDGCASSPPPAPAPQPGPQPGSPSRPPDAPGAAPPRSRAGGDRAPLQDEGKSAHDAFAAAEPSQSPELDRLEPRVEPEGLRPQAPARQPAAPPGFERPPPARPSAPPGPPSRRGPPPRRAERTEPTDAAGRKGLIAAIAAVLVLVLFAGAAYWQRDRISSLFGVVRGLAPQAPRDAGQQPRPKIADRVGQDAQPDATRQGTPAVRPGPSGPAVAQRVVLYEEDPSNPEGNRYVGSALWRTETISPGPGQAPDLAIRVDVEIPERRLAMTMSIRRNTDTGLPATHTVEIMFNLPTDFAFGGVASVPGLLMKEAEQLRGAPLSGLAVKVTNNFFLIGLSAVEADLQRNLTLLKERSWFDIPMVYNNGRKAILAVEKGNPGERAFNDAFTTWKQ